jgi:hypothetical protein
VPPPPRLVSALIHMPSVHTFPTLFPFLILSSHIRLGLQSGVFPSGFPTVVLYALLNSPARATCTTNPIIPDLFTLLIFGEAYEGVSRSFRTESIRKYMLTIINTRWEATQRVMAAKLTRLAHKIAIQLHIAAESYTIAVLAPGDQSGNFWIHPRTRYEAPIMQPSPASYHFVPLRSNILLFNPFSENPQSMTFP